MSDLGFLFYHLAAKLGIQLFFFYLYSARGPHPTGPTAEKGGDSAPGASAPPAGEDQVLTVTRDGEEVGHISLGWGPHYFTPIEASLEVSGPYVHDLVVNKSSRLNGLGRTLVTEAMKASGGDEVYALIAFFNLPSRGLFESCGFKLVCPIICVGVRGWFMRNRSSRAYLHED